MRLTRLALVLLILFMVACTTTGPGAVTTKTPSQAAASSSTTGTLFTINEVGLGPNGYVALTNFTDQPASLGGLFLCQGAQCFALPDVEVAPSATVRVAVGNGTGLGGVVATRAAIGELRSSDGEVALVASQNVKDPKAMLMYLEWGSTPHDNTQTAIDAGLWLKGSYAPSATDATRLFRQDTGLWLFDTK